MQQQIRWALAVGALLGVMTPPVRAQDEKNPFEAYEKAAKPGPKHKLLEPLVGEWTYEAKMWFQPGAPPTELGGITTRKWVLGGRFVMEEVENKKPDTSFRALGFTGYDNVQKHYTAAWMDTMSSGIATSTGQVDKGGKVFTHHNEQIDPASGKKIKGKDVIRVVDNNKHILEMYKEMADGKEFKMMEIVYTRKK